VKTKRNLWILIGIVILSAAVVSGFILMQPSAKDILVQMFENDTTITNGHAIVTINVDSIEKDTSGTVEIWTIRGAEDEEGQSAFRLEVLDASDEKALDALIVSDGETLWIYSPAENKVFFGTPEEAQAMMAENETLNGMFGDFHPNRDGKLEGGEYDHPENTEEAVNKLLEYFTTSKSGTEEVAGETANLLKLEPILEQMPKEYAAVGGYLNLWVGADSHFPLAVAYIGGSMVELTATVLEYEVNAGVDEALFTFEIPASAEVVTFADLEPQSLTLDEANETAEFKFLTPAETPDGATLVDIIDMRGALVQRYTLPEGGYFTIAQGQLDTKATENRTPSRESQAIDVRGTTGQIYASEDGIQVLLTWSEDGLFYSVAGNLSADQALNIAESLQ